MAAARLIESPVWKMIAPIIKCHKNKCIYACMYV
jgi:hypothetical protein